jgi:hypothetical protein
MFRNGDGPGRGFVQQYDFFSDRNLQGVENLKARSLAAATAAAATSLLALAGSAAAEPAWAPADSATVHPGVQTYTEGAQCTSNFVFYDGANNVYIGQAAHCSGTGESTDTNGCTADTHPNGTPVEVDGASRPGTMVYNSWTAMQQNGETDEGRCYGNDFALVKLDPADAAKVNPTVPHWGGPVGITDTTTAGETVLSYGNSSLRFGITQTSPKEGKSLGNEGNNGGWTHPVYTVTPGIPGDSGSAFMNGDGQAIGVLSVLEILPRPASNGVSDLARALDYMRADGAFTDLQLANGTEPFSGPLLP